MTAGVRDQHLTVVGAQCITVTAQRRIIEYAEEKRTEQNLFVRSGESEAEVTNN